MKIAVLGERFKRMSMQLSEAVTYKKAPNNMSITASINPQICIRSYVPIPSVDKVTNENQKPFIQYRAEFNRISQLISDYKLSTLVVAAIASSTIQQVFPTKHQFHFSISNPYLNRFFLDHFENHFKAVKCVINLRNRKHFKRSQHN